MTSFDVVIVGGGASGLMCALTAAQRTRQVLVLDHNNRMGKKILISGGGRCNFTNLCMESNHFFSSNPNFCKSALKRFSQWDFISMVEKHHISYHERENGQLFCDDSAANILEMLLHECKASGVTFQAKTKISAIEATKTCESEKHRFLLKTPTKNIETNTLVIATGGLSYPNIGATNYGHQVARKFSMTVVPTRPALVPFVFSEKIKSLCTRLSGISLEVTLECKGKVHLGQLLFTHRGISGPVVLQISNYWERGEFLKVNLVPGIDLESWLLSMKQMHPKKLLRGLLSDQLPKKLALELQRIFWQIWAEKPIRSIPESVLQDLCLQLTAWKITPKETEGFKKAEATMGGVDTKNLSSKTMESIKQPGLFFIGEVLDVTGQLGGYNLQWAWSSGFAAGQFV